MKLVMYLGNDFIAAVSLNTKKITEPGYVGNLKREMLQKNADLLLHATQEPDFLVVKFSHEFNLN